MMLQTGNSTDYADYQCNRKKVSGISNKGFTLVEVLLAVTILAVGIIGVLRAYATSVNALEVSQENIDAVCLLKEKMAEIEQAGLEQGGIPQGVSSGEFEGSFEGFEWESEVKPSRVDGLNEITLVVSRKEKPRRFSLVTYVESK